MSNDNLALLAASSYGLFKNTNDIKIIQQALLDQSISYDHAVKFTETYKIIAHQANTSSGYSGTIVQNKKSGELFVLHRGTEIETKEDWFEDGLLVVGGLPYRQLMDAKKFVDDNVKNGVLKTGFTNIGHSLGKSISDLVHFTTDRSKGDVNYTVGGIFMIFYKKYIIFPMCLIFYINYLHK